MFSNPKKVRAFSLIQKHFNLKIEENLKTGNFTRNLLVLIEKRILEMNNEIIRFYSERDFWNPHFIKGFEGLL